MADVRLYAPKLLSRVTDVFLNSCTLIFEIVNFCISFVACSLGVLEFLVQNLYSFFELQ